MKLELLILLTLMVVASGCDSRTKSPNNSQQQYLELISNAYQLDDPVEIVEVIERIKEEYSDTKDYSSLHLDLARLYLLAGEEDLAVAEMEQDQSALRNFNLGSLYLRIGDETRGIALLTKFLAESGYPEGESSIIIDEAVLVMTLVIMDEVIPDSLVEDNDLIQSGTLSLQREVVLDGLWPIYR